MVSENTKRNFLVHKEVQWDI